MPIYRYNYHNFHETNEKRIVNWNYFRTHIYVQTHTLYVNVFCAIWQHHNKENTRIQTNYIKQHYLQKQQRRSFFAFILAPTSAASRAICNLLCCCFLGIWSLCFGFSFSNFFYNCMYIYKIYAHPFVLHPNKNSCVRFRLYVFSFTKLGTFFFYFLC